MGPDVAANSTEAIEPYMTYQTFHYFRIVNSYILATSFSFFGMFSNTANIIVFISLGFSESTNISFLALSVCDLLVSILHLIGKLTYNLVDISTTNAGMMVEISFISSIAMVSTSSCGAWITAIVSLERCLCVVFPMKVRSLITHRRIVCLILSMVVYQAVCLILYFVQAGPPYSAYTNITVLYSFIVFSVPSLICFFLVSIATTFLVVKLKQSLKWRDSATNQSGSGKKTGKETRVIKSVVAICSVFIICFTPWVVSMSTAAVIPSFTLQDPYFGWLAHAVFSFNYMSLAVSGSINIIVYYTISSKYRETFQRLFMCKKK